VLVLFATTNRNASISTPVGWTLRGTRLDGTDLESWLFTRVAVAGTAGSTVNAALDAPSKVNLTLVAYSGAGPVQAFASAGETSVRTGHRSPPVSVAAAGSWVASHWVDKSSGNTGWVLPATLTRRNDSAGTGSGALTSVTADSGPVAAQAWPGLTATSGVASGKVISWSVVIPPA
jgi:hypothetical protein